MDKRHRELARLARKYGGTLSHGGKHVRIELPNGRFVIAAATPSNHRDFRNTEAQLRRSAS